MVTEKHKPQSPALTLTGFHAVAVSHLLRAIDGPRREVALLAIGAHVVLAAAEGVRQGAPAEKEPSDEKAD